MNLYDRNLMLRSSRSCKIANCFSYKRNTSSDASKIFKGFSLAGDLDVTCTGLALVSVDPKIVAVTPLVIVPKLSSTTDIVTFVEIPFCVTVEAEMTPAVLVAVVACPNSVTVCPSPVVRGPVTVSPVAIIVATIVCVTSADRSISVLVAMALPLGCDDCA